MKRCVLLLMLVCSVVFGLTSVVQANVIGNPTAGNGWDTTSAVSVTGSHPGHASREWIYTINGAGMDAATGTLHNGGAPHGFMGLAAGDANPRGGTINDGIYGNRWIEYSFDQAYALDSMDVWAYNENNWYQWASFTVKDVYIQVSTTGGTNPAEWTDIGARVLGHSAFDVGGMPVTTSVDLSGVTAQYVVITLVNGREGTYAKGNLGLDSLDFGLSEVRFNEVPEPITMTLMGLGGLVLLKRRR